MYQTRLDYPCPNSALALRSGSWVAAGSLNPLETKLPLLFVVILLISITEFLLLSFLICNWLYKMKV